MADDFGALIVEVNGESGDAFTGRVNLFGIDPTVDRNHGERPPVTVVALSGDKPDALQAVDDRGR